MWIRSVLNKHTFFDDSVDGYTRDNKAFIVKSVKGKFYGVIKYNRYGSPYKEKRLKERDTPEQAMADLKKRLKIKR